MSWLFIEKTETSHIVCKSCEGEIADDMYINMDYLDLALLDCTCGEYYTLDYLLDKGAEVMEEVDLKSFIKDRNLCKNN